jgi:hypothetical protein
MIRLKHTATCAGLMAGGLLSLLVSPAQAFSFTTNFTGNDPKGDILLDSVLLQNNQLISNFSLVDSADIISNTPIDLGSNIPGGASADLGDNATVGLKQEAVDNAGVVTALGNRYLSSIIDTENKGSFVIDLGFKSAVDSLFFWERGANSRLAIQALDAFGSPFGNLLILSSDSSKWSPAGFSLDTTEIRSAQRVTSVGVALADLGVNAPISGLRVSAESSFNGPDFKVVGASTSTSVPEPFTLSGLGLIAGFMAFSRRKSEGQA